MKIIFFSDTHLDSSNKEKTDLVREFIEKKCHDADIVVVLGDLFEFFYGYRDYIYPWYIGVIDCLKAITEKGRKVFFLEGNHEFNIEKSLKSYAGIECSRELILNIEGKKVYIAHGNELVRNYFLMLLKTGFIYRIMELFGPIMTWRIAMFSSIIISDRKKTYREQVKQRFRAIGERKLLEGYDTVILAHTHMPDRVEFIKGASKRLYLNTGDLFKYRSYIEYNSIEGFNVKEYPV